MELNMGKADATVRWLLAVLLVALSVFINDRPALSLVAAAFALVLIATALTHKCPLYSVLGIHTGAEQPRAPRA